MSATASEPAGARAAPCAATERILVVCSANRCRSPLAAALLRERLAARASSVLVGSAGFGPSGEAATSATVETADILGLDLTDHLSRILDATLLERADVIVCMEREHVREIVVGDALTWDRTFTLKELVRRAETAGPRGTGEALTDWLARVGAGRERAELLGASDADDVVDPTGRSAAHHERTAEELDDLLGRLVELAWPA